MALLLHIGYHKTGSTWLQERVLRQQADRFELFGRKDTRESLVAPRSLFFDPSTAREHFHTRIREAIESGRVPVVSDERLSGNPHSGGFDSKELADRLSETFGQYSPKILIVIREQRSMIYSTYAQYVAEGGACSIDDYLAPKTRYCMPRFRLEHFGFDRLLEYYRTLFGTENVLVLTYESFRDNADAFLRTICEHCDAPLISAPEVGERVNPAASPSMLSIQRRLNYFLVRDDLNGGSIFAIPHGRHYALPVLRAVCSMVPKGVDNSIRGRIKAYIDQTCEGMFGDSNHRVSEMTGLPLELQGYEVNQPAKTAWTNDEKCRGS